MDKRPFDADEELAFGSAWDQAERIRSREVSPVELVELTLRRIAELNPGLGAFLTVCESRARSEARQAELDLVNGSEVGPLHGVPFSVKDLESTAGVRTTLGSDLHRNDVPRADSIGVARLRAAGAILVGKTNTPEFGLLGETKNRLGRDCRNPWDLRRTAGGSSGGAAAAIAAGLGSLAVGSDGAGSITAPSSFCGVFGLKPTTGRIPAVPRPGSSRMFVSTGPITRTVRDAALMLSLMGGPDARDPISIGDAPPDYAAVIEGPSLKLRVAWTPDLGHFPADREVLAACESALAAFGDVGWDVRPETPQIKNPWPTYMPLFLADEWVSLSTAVDRHADRFHPEALDEIEPGRDVTLANYIQAVGELREFQRSLSEFFTRYDVLALPSTAVPAFPIGEAPDRIGGVSVAPHWTTFMPFPVAWNMTDQPVCSIPCGLTATGLPIGLMLVGAVGREDLVLAAARQIERAFPVTQRRPSLAQRASPSLIDDALWI